MTEHKCGEECCTCNECCKCGHRGHKTSEECDYAEIYLKLADEAWMELLKEQIKEDIKSKKSDELKRLAHIISKANGEKWDHKIKAKMACGEYRNTLKEFYKCK